MGNCQGPFVEARETWSIPCPSCWESSCEEPGVVHRTLRGEVNGSGRCECENRQLFEILIPRHQIPSHLPLPRVDIRRHHRSPTLQTGDVLGLCLTVNSRVPCTQRHFFTKIKFVITKEHVAIHSNNIIITKLPSLFWSNVGSNILLILRNFYSLLLPQFRQA